MLLETNIKITNIVYQ